LKNNRELVLDSVRKNGISLKYASKELRNDKEIVMVAVKQDRRSFKYASEELQNDKEVILESINDSLDFILVVANQNVLSLKYVKNSKMTKKLCLKLSRKMVV
jgi:dimeric dUTPase (all-alpha-NTP-PPase superfamily)